MLLMMSDRSPRNSPCQSFSFTPVFSRSFEHNTSNIKIWLGSTPLSWENTLGSHMGLHTFANLSRFTIDPAENKGTAAHIMTDTPSSLTVGMRRQSRSYACAGVLQTCTRPTVETSVEDDSSDHITFFYLSSYQIL
ncbi:hypothetical protein TNCV_4900571 [Trichonephila clavipes]|nr:hypothetical protein TNCV_4900571 [Trichonephila clavipes]